ncbi:MAG: glycosyltransferase [Clostridia bacterium]|nr:glycosyltransferase [Clostridia bacterium]
MNFYDIVKIIFISSQIILFLFLIYHGTISAFGFLPVKRPSKLWEPKKRFALVVAAHNEEVVISAVIDSLKKLNYPRELYDIMIIADNCTDNTAQIARKMGAQVFERFNGIERGKGFALKWMFKRIYKMNRHDAIVVFDADNLVDQDYLMYMNNELIQGHKIIQGYLDTKNPDDTWVTKSYAISYWYMARIWQVARQKLQLPGALGGTGMCFEINTLKKLGWDATSLTEDLEFTMKAILRGIKPRWCHHAKIYDEKPLTFVASWDQRLRWMQGHWDVAFMYCGKLFRKFFKEGDFAALDGAFYLLQPGRILLAYFALFVNIFLWISPNINVEQWLNFGNQWPFHIWLTILIVQWLFPPIIAIIVLFETKKIKHLSGLLYYNIFGITWLPLTIIALFTKNNRIWKHTKHTRKISIEELSA